MATILTKKKDTSGAPSAGDLTNSSGGAELAVNTADKRLYTKDSGGNVVEVGTNPSTINIDAGSIDGTPIGANSASTGSFTTLNTSGAVVFNDAGADVDFRVESDTDANALFVEGSSGNVGIGTSSPAATYSRNLQITGSSNAGIRLTTNTYTSGFDIVQGADGNANVLNRNNYALIFSTNDTERMRIDSSGNVGIGTSSPSAKLDVTANSATTGASLNITNTSQTSQYLNIVMNGSTGVVTGWDNSAVIEAVANAVGSGTRALYLSAFNGPMIFATNSRAERMRITSGGEVYIAGTTDQGAYNLQCNGTGVWGQGAYVNGSDERMKQNITDLQDGLSVVTQLRPVTYQYREEFSRDQNTQPGFIAQELQAVLDGKDYKDGVVPEGPEYLNVAYQNLIPILTKAIQELKAELDTVKAELATLKG